MDEAAAARMSAFGRYLLQERELRGLSRDEVARRTKLTPTVIEALESGDPARMPPRAYLLGYLRSYAVTVGLDPDDVVLRWQEAAAEEPEPDRTSAARQRRRLPALVLLIAFALAAAALASWWVSRRNAPDGLQERLRTPMERMPYRGPGAPQPGRP